jgi:hypothetical protein
LLYYDTEASFVQSIFQENLLPRLRFLKSLKRTRSLLLPPWLSAQMQQLIVREDYWSLTNEALDIGWKQVVGKPSSCPLGLVKSHPLCKTVTKTMVTLPSRAGNGKVICSIWRWAR